MMTKKSIIDEAKELFSSWKSEIEERDGDILERKRKRDEENEQLNKDLKVHFNEVANDINEKGKRALEVFNKEFNEFSQAVKDGTADIYKKAEIEKHAEQLMSFLDKIKSKGAEKFKETVDNLKSKLSEQEEELISEIEETDKPKKEDEDIEPLIKQAQEEYGKNKESDLKN
ncbi:MAG: hypothetical protein L3J56_00030 [Bacteroidales bacterium]|nr:hypothetical protein [Bacteroidales bacterium]